MDAGAKPVMAATAIAETVIKLFILNSLDLVAMAKG